MAPPAPGAAPAGRPRTRPVTGTDVARAAGVSQSTVSLALSGSPRIPAATRERILAVCEQLAYRPSAAGRQLRTGRSHTIGVLVPSIGSEIFDLTLRGIRSVLADEPVPGDPDARYTILIGCTANDRTLQHDLTATIGAHDFDGLVLMTVGEPDAATVRRFTGRMVVLADGVPEAAPTAAAEDVATAAAVDAGTAGAPGSAPRFGSAVTDALHECVGELVALGHRRIAYLSALPGSTRHESHRASFRAAVAPHLAAGVGVAELDAAALTIEAAEAAVGAALDAPGPGGRPTAIVSDASQLSAGVYAAAERRGLRIPDDLSVVGVNDDTISRSLRPALTCVRFAGEALGVAAARALVAMLRDRGGEGPATTGAGGTAPVLLPCEVRRGGSVGPAPRPAAT